MVACHGRTSGLKEITLDIDHATGTNKFFFLLDGLFFKDQNMYSVFLAVVLVCQPQRERHVLGVYSHIPLLPAKFS